MKNLQIIKFIFLCTLFIILFSSSVLAFTDVVENNWAKTAIDSMQSRGILDGYEDGTFLPSKYVTREEFAKIMVKTLNLTEQDFSIKYEDIEDNRWSKKYIDIAGKYFTAYKVGDKYYFRPTEYALREDIIVTTVCALQLENSDYDLNILEQFSDKDLITSSLRKYIAIAVEEDLINGNADGTINPQGRLTRAEVSQFMYNILVRLEQEEFEKIPLIEEKDKLENEEKEENDEKQENMKPEEEKKKLKEVKYGEIKKFAKKLKKGEDFTVMVNGNTIEGNMWKNGSLFELYPYFEGVKFTEQYNVNKKIESWCTMYGAEQSAKVYGFEIEKIDDDNIRFVYEMDDKKYYADSVIEKTHVQSEVIENFICFVLNNDKNVKIEFIESEKEDDEETDIENEEPNHEIPVERVNIEYSNIHISLAKEEYKLEVDIMPSNATNKEIIWKSSNETIATIDEDGKITPKAVGETIITAMSSNGKKATCALRIYALKYDSTILDVGVTECIVHGADKLKDFKSSNIKVATVDQKGNVTALSPGEAIITAKDNNNVEIKCVITVKDDNTFLEPVVLEMTPNQSVFGLEDIITLSVKSGTLQGSEVIVWEFGLDGKEIATNSGYSMKISKLVDIAKKRYGDDLYNKEITLKAFPRDVRDNSDRESTIFKFEISNT